MSTPAPPLQQQFAQPSWTTPIDIGSVIQGIPAETTLSGMFFQAIVEAARRLNATLPSAQERYLPFRFYPLRDFARMLVEGAALFHPEDPLRLALRKMGRTAPSNLLSSTVGKVVLGSAHGVHEVLQTVSRTYPINLRPSQAEVVESGDGFAVVRLTDVYYFLDCHHVGVLEGTLEYAGVRGVVRIRPLGRGVMEYLCTW